MIRSARLRLVLCLGCVCLSFGCSRAALIAAAQAWETPKAVAATPVQQQPARFVCKPAPYGRATCVQVQP